VNNEVVGKQRHIIELLVAMLALKLLLHVLLDEVFAERDFTTETHTTNITDKGFQR
jgi:hypothetical protein